MRISDWSSDVCSSDLFAFEHIADNFHVPVTMGAETLAGCHGVVIEHAQVAMTLVVDIEIISERKAVGAVEPTVAGASSFRSEERRVGKECVSTCRSRW